MRGASTVDAPAALGERGAIQLPVEQLTRNGPIKFTNTVAMVCGPHRAHRYASKLDPELASDATDKDVACGRT